MSVIGTKQTLGMRSALSASTAQNARGNSHRTAADCYCGCDGNVTGGVCSGGVAGGVCSGTVIVGGVAVVSGGGVAGSDQTTSSAMTTAAAMMSNLFLSIGLPLSASQ